jgi:hypothetical protein
LPLEKNPINSLRSSYVKILGSSTFAVAETLSSIIERLKALKRLEVEDFADIDTAEEIAEDGPPMTKR